MDADYYPGRRLSYDGSLCTVRFFGSLSGTKGSWLGVEWDDPARGKHNGKHQGQQIFTCLRASDTVASFVRPMRKSDDERTVLEAIRYKYSSGTSDASGRRPDVVVISGKVAEEIGFEKIAAEQAQLADLRVVLLDQLVINGVARRGVSPSDVAQAQEELSRTCPNVQELDIGWNTIETWRDVAEICRALPSLKVLKAGGLRLRLFHMPTAPSPFPRIRELHLEECLLDTATIAKVLGDERSFASLTDLHLSGNMLADFTFPTSISTPCLERVEFLALERNRFEDLKCIRDISAVFPRLVSLSLKANIISRVGERSTAPNQSFTHINALNLSDNGVDTFEFLDALPHLLPNLSSLQVTNNPLFHQGNPSVSDDPRASEKLFYLTLARIPTLETLNYTKINARERQEGELYFLSIAEKDLKTLSTDGTKVMNRLGGEKKLYPLYQTLVKKYGRDSVIDAFNSTAAAGGAGDTINDGPTSQLDYPPGSLGARLVEATFYIQEIKIGKSPNRNITEAILTLPTSLPVKQVMAILLRHPKFQGQLRPSKFDLIFESRELDPVDTTTESSTRSAMYGMTAEQKQNLWKEWGDWDADTIVERETQSALGEKSASSLVAEDNWTKDGKFCIRDGRKWKRREVNIPHSLKRAWGDWLDDTKELTIRIELL